MSHEINTELNLEMLISRRLEKKLLSYVITAAGRLLVIFRLRADIILQAIFCLPFIKTADRNEVVSLSGNKLPCLTPSSNSSPIDLTDKMMQQTAQPADAEQAEKISGYCAVKHAHYQAH